MSLALITMFTELSSNCNLKNTLNLIQKMEQSFLRLLSLLMENFEYFIEYYHDPNQTHINLGEIIGNMLKSL